jgi:hypothetical protein
LSSRKRYEVGIEIGGLPVALHSYDAEFAALLHRRYANFLCDPSTTRRLLDTRIIEPAPLGREVELKVVRECGEWVMNRGDFMARWNPQSGRGSVTQSANPYSIDSALRIIHSLELATAGGFLLHAASAIRNRRAFLFSGISGAGKTTITRLAPPDAIRLTDEISYVRAVDGAYHAFGTPFSGELNTPGENDSARIATLFFLRQGGENRICALPAETAVCKLLRNILFFAHDDDLTAQVFRAACEFVEAVETCELIFRPEPEVWRLVA